MVTRCSSSYAVGALLDRLVPARPGETSVPEDWLDSPDVVKAALDAGASDFIQRTGAKLGDVSF